MLPKLAAVALTQFSCLQVAYTKASKASEQQSEETVEEEEGASLEELMSKMKKL